MNADHQHDTPEPKPNDQQPEQLPEHPFTRAWAIWEAWSRANAMRQAHKVAHQRGDQKTLASFERYPEWTQGPGPLEALAANCEVVGLLTGWRWQAIREAREQGHGWREIGTALQVDGERAKRDYLERVDRQRLASERDPDLARLLRYDPRWRELAEPNQADRAELEARALAHDDAGCPPDWPPRAAAGLTARSADHPDPPGLPFATAQARSTPMLQPTDHRPPRPPVEIHYLHQAAPDRRPASVLALETLGRMHPATAITLVLTVAGMAAGTVVAIVALVATVLATVAAIVGTVALATVGLAIAGIVLGDRR